MTRPRATSRLTADEAQAARTLVDKLGADKAARQLGVYHRQTLFKAIAQLDVSHLTASTIRASLTTRKI